MKKTPKLTSFERGYIDSALWITCDSDGSPLEESYSLSDFAPKTIRKIKTDCQKFLDLAMKQCLWAPEDSEQAERAGQVLYLDRNGHGAGFWDGRWEHGDTLTEIADQLGESELYVGDDGKIYAT